MQQAPSGGEHEAEVLQPTRGVLSGETWEATPDGLQASPSPLALALTLTLARTRTRTLTLTLALTLTLTLTQGGRARPTLDGCGPAHRGRGGGRAL